jgi:hypothetical protein
MSKDIPAFPNSAPGAQNYDGMTLRDYFAGQALMGELSSQPRGDFLNEQTLESAALLAVRAYKFADAMLTAREK